MKGWILYKRSKSELTEADHGVNRLLAEANRLQVELDVIKPAQLELLVSSTHNGTILEGKQTKFPDFLIPRMGADTTYQAMALIRQLELCGVYCANNPTSIDNSRDKLWLSQLLRHNNLPVPKTLLLNFPLSIEWIEQEIGFPLVIKNISGARGLGVFLCENANILRDLMGLISENQNQPMIAQQFIANSYGRDLRVFIVGKKIVGCMQRKAHDSFKANYSLGADVTLFDMNAELEKMALDCINVTGLEIAGIDLLFGEQNYIICEANSSPGFKGMELATGENIGAQILEFVLQKAVSRHNTLVRDLSDLA